MAQVKQNRPLINLNGEIGQFLGCAWVRLNGHYDMEAARRLGYGITPYGTVNGFGAMRNAAERVCENINIVSRSLQQKAQRARPRRVS